MQRDPGYIQWPLVESQMKRAWMNVFAFVKRRRIEAEVEEVGPLNLCYAANTNLVTGDFLRLCDIWLLVWLFMLWPWQCDYGMTCKDILWQWGVLSVLLLLLYKLVMSKISLQTSKIFGKRRRSEYNWNPDGQLNSISNWCHASSIIVGGCGNVIVLCRCGDLWCCDWSQYYLHSAWWWMVQDPQPSSKQRY